MKKVLIITYYWIPSGGAGVQRWVKFTKYLREFGIEPIIYTPENPEYPSEDWSFKKDIPSEIKTLKTPIWEPYNVYRTISGRKGEKMNAGFLSENKRNTWKDRLSIAVRGNFLIPDPRCFWIKPSVRFLHKYILKNQIDTIITTGPPHSMHLIGLGLKKKISQLKWIADFRDPWTNIDFYKELKLNYFADKIHRRLEKNVLKTADCVVVVSEGMKEEFIQLQNNDIQVITNGFDTDDISTNITKLDEYFTISHIGTLNATRNPINLWKVLRELCEENDLFRKDLRIQLVGKTDFSIIENIEKNNLSSNLLKIDYLSHIEALEKQISSQVLLLLINQTQNAKGILTGKFFEYLAAQRPIIALGPKDGDVAKILDKTKAGYIIDYQDKKTLKETIIELYNQFRNNNLKIRSDFIEEYSRKSLTKKLSDLIYSL